MTRDETIGYISIDGTSDGIDPIPSDLAVIEFAEDRGYPIEADHERVVISAMLTLDGEVTNLDRYDLAKDVSTVAADAVAWLNDQGLLPNGYGYDDERPGDGYGLDTNTEEGS